jgi:hypothetical protein
METSLMPVTSTGTRIASLRRESSHANQLATVTHAMERM